MTTPAVPDTMTQLAPALAPPDGALTATSIAVAADPPAAGRAGSTDRPAGRDTAAKVAYDRSLARSGALALILALGGLILIGRRRRQW